MGPIHSPISLFSLCFQKLLYSVCMILFLEVELGFLIYSVVFVFRVSSASLLLVQFKVGGFPLLQLRWTIGNSYLTFYWMNPCFFFNSLISIVRSQLFQLLLHHLAWKPPTVAICSHRSEARARGKRKKNARWVWIEEDFVLRSIRIERNWRVKSLCVVLPAQKWIWTRSLVALTPLCLWEKGLGSALIYCLDLPPTIE